MLNTNTTPAQTIERLKELYHGNKFEFEFYASGLIAGDQNKQTRKAIVKIITGEDRPLTKCGFHAVTDILKNSFDQLTIF